MSSVAAIEDAIEKLPAEQVAELAAWLAEFRRRTSPPAPIDRWLRHACGAARPGVTTESAMSLTRGVD